MFCEHNQFAMEHFLRYYEGSFLTDSAPLTDQHLNENLKQRLNESNESTDVKVINIVKDKLEIEISASDIDRSHRIGKKSSGKKRPIIIKFARYNCRRRVYHNKKKIKRFWNVDHRKSD